VEISKMLLGPLPEGFEFVPKHKSNSYPTPATTAPALSTSETAPSAAEAPGGEPKEERVGGEWNGEVE
jgi:hypothetical protein